MNPETINLLQRAADALDLAYSHETGQVHTKEPLAQEIRLKLNEMGFASQPVQKYERCYFMTGHGLVEGYRPIAGLESSSTKDEPKLTVDLPPNSRAYIYDDQVVVVAGYWKQYGQEKVVLRAKLTQP